MSTEKSRPNWVYRKKYEAISYWDIKARTRSREGKEVRAFGYWIMKQLAKAHAESWGGLAFDIATTVGPGLILKGAKALKGARVAKRVPSVYKAADATEKSIHYIEKPITVGGVKTVSRLYGTKAGLKIYKGVTTKVPQQITTTTGTKGHVRPKKRASFKSPPVTVGKRTKGSGRRQNIMVFPEKVVTPSAEFMKNLRQTQALFKKWPVPAGRYEPFPKEVGKVPLHQRQNWLNKYYKVNPLAAEQAKTQSKIIIDYTNKVFGPLKPGVGNKPLRSVMGQPAGVPLSSEYRWQFPEKVVVSSKKFTPMYMQWKVPVGQRNPYPVAAIQKVPMAHRPGWSRTYYQYNPQAAQRARMDARFIINVAHAQLR